MSVSPIALARFRTLGTVLTCCLLLVLVVPGTVTAATTAAVDGGASDTTVNVTQTGDGDRLGPNDRQSGATDLGTGGSFDDLSIHDTTDGDYFAIEAEDDEVIEVDASFSHAQGDLDLTLVDDTGALVGSSISVTDGEELSYEPPSDGTYYAVVYGFAGATNDYDLTVGTTDLRESGDRLERNDDRATATPLDSGGSYDDLNVSHAIDEDYFAVETTAGETVTADATFDDAAGDLDMSLMDASGTTVADADSISDDEHLGYEADSDGTYYVVVYSYEDATNDYDLSVGTTGDGTNLAPTAVASVDDSAVRRNASVSFDARNSTDGDAIASYEWDTDGDGTAEISGASPTYVFESGGSYDLTLMVTDADGAMDTEDALLPDADPLQFDIYVEVDYIDENPMTESDYERVRAGLDSDRFENPDGTTGMNIHIVEGGEVSVVADANNPTAYRNAYQNDTYACAGYHYAMVTDTQPWATALGVGERGRFIVTDDDSGLTFIHELGHSLGLGFADSGGELHGTFEYPWEQFQSVMNYNYSPLFPLEFSDGTESRAAHDDWEFLNEDAYAPGWQGNC